LRSVSFFILLKINIDSHNAEASDVLSTPAMSMLTTITQEYFNQWHQPSSGYRSRAIVGIANGASICRKLIEFDECRLSRYEARPYPYVDASRQYLAPNLNMNARWASLERRADLHKLLDATVNSDAQRTVEKSILQ